MYGLITNIIAGDDQRDSLISILLEGSKDLPGNIHYLISKDENDSQGIWIHEVWETKEQHGDSLQLPQVIQALEQGRPLIESLVNRWETQPVNQ